MNRAAGGTRSVRHFTDPTYLLVIAAAAVAVLAACTPASTPTPTPLPPSAEALRDSTVAALRLLSSVHFVVTHAEGGTDLGAGITLTSAEGDALFPDRAKLTAQTVVEGLGVNLEMGIVQIGPETYLRDPLSRVWRSTEPGVLPFNFVGMHDSIANALAATTELALTYGEVIDSMPVYRLTGSVRPQEFRGLVPGASEGEPLDLEVWIGQDLLPRRVSLRGRLVEDDPPDMVRFLHLSDFNAPVSVEPPI